MHLSCQVFAIILLGQVRSVDNNVTANLSRCTVQAQVHTGVILQRMGAESECRQCCETA